jgi:cytoplasmic iron level regulating protein YaaA (DUF328/UPF0246 family)
MARVPCQAPRVAKPLLLIPPSEAKAPGGDGPPWSDSARAFPQLDPQRREVINALRRTMRGDADAAAKLLGVGPAAAADAISQNLVIDSAPTMPAIARYEGVLYDALDYPALPARQRKRIDEQVAIVSAVWGVVAPRDPIPDYKLKMSASLDPLGRLSTWWRPAVSRVLDELAAGRVVWNLLPTEHSTAWRSNGSSNAVIRVRFLDEVERNGRRELVTVSHWNKLLKGALVRHVVANQVEDPDALAKFEHPQGYVYRPELTDVKGLEIDVALVATR